MDEVSELKKKIFKKVLLVSVPVVLLLFLLGRPLIAVSYAFGIGVGCLNIHLLSLDLLKMNYGEGGAQRRLLKSFLLRYVILFLSFAVIFIYHFNVIAFIVGFFKVKLILTISQIYQRERNEN